MTTKFAIGFLLLASWMAAEPVPARRVQGYLHGFLVLKDLDDKILATGGETQSVAGDRVTTVLSLQFKDGSFYQETAVYTQHGNFRLLSYKQIQKGPAFKTPQTLSVDATGGKVNIQYTDKDGKAQTIADQQSLPPDLANGMVPMLLTNVDPKVETTLSMLVTTPKPRLVKLKIASVEESSFSVGGVAAKATHYVVNIDLGAVTGTVAKIVGKQPPPTHVWVAAGAAPIFLKSEGQLYEDGPIWRIELASPVWPKTAAKH